MVKPNRIPRQVVHYSEKDPRTTTGGVETFARNLALIFEQVDFMTPDTIDVDLVRNHRLPVICDNQWVLDWPKDVPVIGFRHGVAAEKLKATRSPGHILLSRRQSRASRRPNTLWVACAQWIASAFEQLHGSGTSHVVYHPIDMDRFDGRLENETSRLILHDARLKHKGSRLLPHVAKAFPEWNFEHLACRPDEVADRMRKAAAFVHLSRYEGNSIVCNEAMAMNLPCLFTRVGLMRDTRGPTDVFVIDSGRAYRDRGYLMTQMKLFLGTLGDRSYQPREWMLANATLDSAIRKWEKALMDFDRMAAF